MIPLLIKSFKILFLIYICFMAVLFLGQRIFIFPQQIYDATPQEAGLTNFTEVKLNSANGTIYGWYAPAKDKARTIVYFPGNAQRFDRESDNELLIKLAEEGYGVLALVYNGYGKSEGSPSEESFYNDGRAAINFIKTQVAERKIIIFGRSIGTGVATQMAAEYELGGVILLSPFTSVVDAASDLYWFYPIKPFNMVKYKFDSYSKIKNISEPLLIIHGARDWLVPIKFGQKLFAAANQPKRFIRLPEAGHFYFDNDVLVQDIKSFLDQLSAGKKNATTRAHYS